jgi:hypothetical protein
MPCSRHSYFIVRLIEPMQAGVRKVALDVVPPQPGWHVLDVGCGTDPPLAISSARALVEATCKHVLEELEESYDDKADLPALVKAVQKALKVHPDTIAPTAKGRDTIVRTLSNLSQVAIGLAELRNEYGPDHGRTRSTSGMRPRHAHLAIGAAQTYCRFLLETLRDRRSAVAP